MEGSKYGARPPLAEVFNAAPLKQIDCLTAYSPAPQVKAQQGLTTFSLQTT